MANIQKRPNGTWRARYRDSSGKEHARHFVRKVDAPAWLDSNARRAWFDAAAAAIGEPGLTPHELRHTAASLAVSAGANVKAVQAMLGHASAAMTLDTYADLFDRDLDAVADRLDVVVRTARGLLGDSLRTGARIMPSRLPSKYLPQ